MHFCPSGVREVVGESRGRKVLEVHVERPLCYLNMVDR